MMADPRIHKLASLLVNYCVAVQPGDKVMLTGGPAAMPLVTETYREIIRAGGMPNLFWDDIQFREIMLKEGSEEQLRYVPDNVKLAVETFDCRITIRGHENTRALSGIDPARQQILAAGQRELIQTFMERSAKGELRWVGTLFPTNAYAQDADMSLADFADFVYGACHADKDDPVAEWQKLSKFQQKLVDYLDGKEQVVVKGPNVDLALSIKGRTFINSDGHKNMPSGEIFTGPVEESVNGWIRYTFPAIYQGRQVEGIELWFEEGKVVKATAVKNQDFLLSVLDTDEGARYLGEFAIGTNDAIDRFTGSILFDEKIGGTIHLAVGSGYPETGSVNKSAVHWDMICDMRDGGQIWVDGELFYENGRFPQFPRD
jgi:aminopeptidase